jgi:hypothetical protein
MKRVEPSLGGVAVTVRHESLVKACLSAPVNLPHPCRKAEPRLSSIRGCVSTHLKSVYRRNPADR